MNPLKPIGHLWLKTYGWRVENRVPDVEKCVIIAAPHTSNWDFPFTIAVASALNLDFYWLGKHTMFENVFGPLLKNIGGIPIDRRTRGNYVEQIADFIQEKDRIALALAPEGTRSKVERWKSGFYHIARTANVPIVLGFLDFENKVGGLGKAIWPIGTKDDVLGQIRDFYHAEMAYCPELFVDPCFRAPRSDQEE